jgi:phenylacetate-CoA ligase
MEYVHRTAGRNLGEPLLTLWGSERDVFRAGEKLSARLEKWLTNTVILNTFLMSEERMQTYAQRWRDFKPVLVVAYTSGIHELARYLDGTRQEVPSPRAILCCAETLNESVRTYIEKVFECPALNYYGGRDIGAVAFECREKKGMHIFSVHTKVEVLNAPARPCEPDEIGQIIITNLDNFSMPLIRYRSGDTAQQASGSLCPCGRGWPLIRKVMGREMEMFRTRDGTAVPGEFFIHAVGVVYNKDYIRKFQVTQEDYDDIIVKLVMKNRAGFELSKDQLAASIRKVMGPQCKVTFSFVDDIEPTKSGKFLYTISKVARS